MADLAYIQLRIGTVGPCITCGVEITMPAGLLAQLEQNHANFYCVNGHAQHFSGKSKLDKALEELEAQKKATERARLETEAARATRDTARRAEAIARGKLRAQSSRIKNGVCPCCKRTFQNLHAHMKGQHPEFAHEASE